MMHNTLSPDVSYYVVCDFKCDGLGLYGPVALRDAQKMLKNEETARGILHYVEGDIPAIQMYLKP